jgi:hypothetical protein
MAWAHRRDFRAQGPDYASWHAGGIHPRTGRYGTLACLEWLDDISEADALDELTRGRLFEHDAARAHLYGAQQVR